jgi:hypothetical protein
MMNESGQEPGGRRFYAQDQVDFKTACGSCERQTDVWTRPVQFRPAGAHRLPLKPLNSPRWTFHTRSNWFLFCPLRFVMAALESTPFVQFAFPQPNQPFSDRNTLWSFELSRSIPSLNASGSQRIHRPTATFSRSGYQIEAGRNTAARAEGTWTSYTESEFVLCAPADNNNGLDDDLPSLEEQSRATLRPKISTEASNDGYTLQRLDQPALPWAGLQDNRAQSGLGERQGGSRGRRTGSPSCLKAIR